jgi:hypothetical protein
MATTPLLALLLLAGGAGPQNEPALRSEVGRLEARVAVLSAAVQERDELLGTVREQLDGVRHELAQLREHPPRDIAAAFLASPANGSDRLGVARAAVFAPRVEVDSSLRHDTVYLTVKRIEPTTVTAIAEIELSPDQNGVDLPLDDSGALYVVDWETSEGHVYNLVLRDGASEQPAASVRVHEYQSRGRFAFVGYRVE